MACQHRPGGTEGVKIEEEWRAEEGSKESEEDNDHDEDDKGRNYTLSRESETKELTKPPAKIRALT